MSGLAWRLKRLERVQQIGRLHYRCPGCGRLPNGRCPDDGSVKFECSLEGYDREPEGPEFCPVCGGRLIFTMTFDDRG